MLKRCFFIGHRDTRDEVFTNLMNVVRIHVEMYGVQEFIVGRYGNFDKLAAKAVNQIKKSHPEITLTLLCPYHPGMRAVRLPKGFDSALYPFDKPVPYRLAIVLANEKAIDMCDYLIAFVNHLGKSRDFLELAMQREKKGLIRITNLGHFDPKCLDENGDVSDSK